MSASFPIPQGPTIRSVIERPSADLQGRAAKLPAATLHEAGGRIGVMPSEIKPVARGMRICGPAVTVASPGGDNLWLHRALYVAQPGDVLVVHVSGAFDYGYWGEIMLFGSLTVSAGDLVVGDRDGVVVVPLARAEAVVTAAEEREAKEAQVLQRIAAGERTLELYNF